MSALTIVWVAFFASLCAVFSGIKVVGSGTDWEFTPRDILWGRENALTYLWVTFSTIFSICHAGMIGIWIYIEGPQKWGTDLAPIWFSLHAAMGALFTAIHIILKAKLKADRGNAPRYLWKAV